jgi:hypothetical protein
MPADVTYSYVDIGSNYADSFYVHDRSCYFSQLIYDIVNTGPDHKDRSDMFSSMRVEVRTR